MLFTKSKNIIPITFWNLENTGHYMNFNCDFPKNGHFRDFFSNHDESWFSCSLGCSGKSVLSRSCLNYLDHQIVLNGLLKLKLHFVDLGFTVLHTWYVFKSTYFNKTKHNSKFWNRQVFLINLKTTKSKFKYTNNWKRNVSSRR